MLQALGVPGVLEHLVPAVAIATLGYLMFVFIWKGIRAFSAWVTELITKAIDLHVKEHHTADEAWRCELRAAIERLRTDLAEQRQAVSQDIKDVHRRIDRIYRNPEDSQP